MYHNYTVFNKEKLFLRFNGFELNTKNYNRDLLKIKKKLAVCVSNLDKMTISDDFKINISEFMKSPLKFFDDVNKRKNFIKECEKYPKFNLLVNKIFDLFKNSDKISQFKDEILSRIYWMYFNLQIINNFDRLIVDQFKQLKIDNEKACKLNPLCPQLKIPKNALIIYDTSLSSQLLYRIPTYLNTLNILQDRILPIIALREEIGKVPNILSEYFQKDSNGSGRRTYIPNSKLKKFDSKIQNVVQKYWKDHGQSIRNFRNLDQHHFHLVLRYGINHNDDFVVYFPDTKEKMFEDVTFNSKINGIELINSEFLAFHDFVDDLMKILNIDEKNFQIESIYSKPESIEHYEENECMAIFQSGNKAILNYCRNKKIDGTGSELVLRKLDLKSTKITITIV